MGSEMCIRDSNNSLQTRSFFVVPAIMIQYIKSVFSKICVKNEVLGQGCFFASKSMFFSFLFFSLYMGLFTFLNLLEIFL